MKYFLLLAVLLSIASVADESKGTKSITIVCPSGSSAREHVSSEKIMSPVKRNLVLSKHRNIRISVTGQGVAPMHTASPAQAYAMAKRAATADAYRLIAEKVKGVRIDGQDLIKNMMVKRSTVRTSVQAMVRNANIVETTYKDGLCEVEMEVKLSRSQFPQ